MVKMTSLRSGNVIFKSYFLTLPRHTVFEFLCYYYSGVQKLFCVTETILSSVAGVRIIVATGLKIIFAAGVRVGLSTPHS